MEDVRALLIASAAPIIGFNFWLAGGQMVTLVREVVEGQPTAWTLIKAILASTFGIVFLIRLMMSLERIRSRQPR